MYFTPPKILRRMLPGLTWQIITPMTVYLTFDDGPSEQMTPWVLDELAKYNFKATFFCIGKNAELHPEIIDRIRAERHAIGNHTYSHTKQLRSNTGAYVEDVEMANNFTHSTLFRPPYGRIWRGQLRRLTPRYHVVMWNILSRDYSSMVSPERCVREVVPHLREGAIIVFHDSLKASRNLYYALPKVLEAIAAKGYKSAAIDL